MALLNRAWLFRSYRLIKKMIVATPITTKENRLIKMIVVWICDRIFICQYVFSWLQCSLDQISSAVPRNNATRKRKALNRYANSVISSIAELSRFTTTTKLSSDTLCQSSSYPFVLTCTNSALGICPGNRCVENG